MTADTYVEAQLQACEARAKALRYFLSTDELNRAQAPDLFAEADRLQSIADAARQVITSARRAAAEKELR